MVRFSTGAFLLSFCMLMRTGVARGEEPFDARDLVLHAAGAVQLRPPVGWHTREVPLGREVRLVSAPARDDRSTIPQDGIWLVFHPRRSGPLPETDFAEVFRSRLAATTPNARPGTAQQLLIAGHPAMRSEFRRTSTAPKSEGQPVTTEGFHLLVNLPWGLCEMHAESPSDRLAVRAGQFEAVVRSLRLQPPRQIVAPVSASVRDAEAIVGSWKAYNSRLRLHPDGRIVIITDRRITDRRITDRRITDRRSGWAREDRKAADHPPNPITGQFGARNDLLLVTWDDGSRLNFRWRLHGESLLLTDHEGQISQLRRIVE